MHAGTSRATVPPGVLGTRVDRPRTIRTAMINERFIIISLDFYCLTSIDTCFFSLMKAHSSKLRSHQNRDSTSQDHQGGLHKQHSLSVPRSPSGLQSRARSGPPPLTCMHLTPCKATQSMKPRKHISTVASRSSFLEYHATVLQLRQGRVDGRRARMRKVDAVAAFWCSHAHLHFPRNATRCYNEKRC